MRLLKPLLDEIMKREEENGYFGATLFHEESLGFVAQAKVPDNSDTLKKLDCFCHKVLRQRTREKKAT